MDAARELLRTRVANGGLTVEEVKAAMGVVFAEHNTSCDDFIVAPGPQGAVGHDMGSGPIAAGVPVVIDIWPRDNTSYVYCDMTRTFVVGDVPENVATWHRLCKEALDRAISEIKDGASGRDIFDGTCEIFEAAGEQTPRTKEDGVPLADGFFHGLGHGVGPRGARGAGARADRRVAAPRRRRRHRRAGSLPGGLRRRPARGPRAGDEGRGREPHGLPVRPGAVGFAKPSAGSRFVYRFPLQPRG